MRSHTNATKNLLAERKWTPTRLRLANAQKQFLCHWYSRALTTLVLLAVFAYAHFLTIFI